MNHRNVVGAVFVILSGFTILRAAAQVPPTPAEEIGYVRYSQNEDIARFLSILGAQCRDVKIRIVGRSKDVPGYPAKDIFLAVISENGAGRAADLDRAKPTILLTAAQHGNEQSAKEAALRLLRDFAGGELKPFLKTLNVLIMPQTNPYGNQFDVRTNEIELDMNRDHVKVEAEGVAAIHRVFREFMPEVTIDVHEKGMITTASPSAAFPTPTSIPGFRTFPAASSWRRSKPRWTRRKSLFTSTWSAKRWA